MNMIKTTLVAAVSAAALLTLPGCAVTRGQSTVGAYVDDATITTQIKARMTKDREVDAIAIKVQTLNGEVILSGFAKNQTEKDEAERIAKEINGVKRVKNDILVRS